MSRSQRLLDLLQELRRHRYPIAGNRLAETLGISLRTLYRDIATLQAQGAEIEGSPGVGYVLKPGFLLPPLMFSQEELEALVLGIRWVSKRGDPALQAAASHVLAKVAAVLPADLKSALDDNALLIGPSAQPSADRGPSPDRVNESEIRRSIRFGFKATIRYRDQKEMESCRTVWPFALGYFDGVRVLVAWCEMRAAFRHFRTDRIADVVVQGVRYPRRRQALLKEWRQREGIPPL